jgi:hypothetical protein
MVKATTTSGDSLEGFEQFWTAYPVKTSIYEARHAFVEMQAGKIMPAILAAIAAQKQSRQWRDDGGKYIPSPANWLRAGRWQDCVEPIQKDLSTYRMANRDWPASGPGPQPAEFASDDHYRIFRTGWTDWRKENHL